MERERPRRPGPGRAWSRRRFISTLARSAAGLAGLPALPVRSLRAGEKPGGPPAGRKKVALLATAVHRYSHPQHFIDRLLEGYGWQGRHHRPPLDLVSLYVDQFPGNDLARERSRRHRVPIYPTIAEALTLGGPRLAVDGVLVIGEHGKYPKNDRGQTLYPRYRFFKETVKVFEASGRSVPVFNDKHLSTEWKECREMVDDSRRLGFAFLAGSSLPVTWRIPSVELPLDLPIEESVCAMYGGVDSYDFHGYETAQCMSERRAGGESGVQAVEGLRGEKVWALLRERDATRRLLLAALARSHSVTPPEGYTFPVLELDRLREACPDPIAFLVEHRDGFRTGVFLLNGLIRDFNYAGRVKATGEVISCQMHLPMPPSRTTLASFFNPQMNHIERMVLEGRAPYPVERTLLTSGMTLAGVESLHRGARVETPGMEVAYRPPAGSTYWRA